MSKRVIAMTLVFLALFMFVGGPFQQSAHAVVIVDDAIMAIIIATLAAMGITFTYTGGYYTLYDWLQGVIQQSGASFSGVQAGVNNISNILLSNKFVREISILASYITTTFGVGQYESVQVLQSTYACQDELTGNVYIPGTYTSNTVFTMGTELFSYTPNASPVGTVRNYIYRFSGKYFKLTLNQTNATTVQTSAYSSDDGVSYDLLRTMLVSGSGNYVRTEHVCLVYDDGEIWFLMSNGVNQYGGSATVTKIAKVAGVSLGNDLYVDGGFIDIPSNEDIEGKSGVLDLPVPWGLTFGEVLDEIPDLSDEDELEGNTFLDLEDTNVVTDQLDQAATNAPSISDEPSEYQSAGLQNVFPFCIPFDIYAFFECLAAEPEAPSFVWRFYIPGICDEDIEIDLAAFDSAARILRTMELLLFIVGLAFVTRDKFLRG